MGNRASDHQDLQDLAEGGESEDRVESESDRTAGLATCVHCGGAMRYDPYADPEIERCPHCCKKSVLGPQSLKRIRKKAISKIVAGTFLILGGTGIFATVILLRHFPLVFSVYFGLAAIGVGIMELVRGCVLLSVRMSKLGHLAVIPEETSVPVPPITDTSPPYYPGVHK